MDGERPLTAPADGPGPATGSAAGSRRKVKPWNVLAVLGGLALIALCWAAVARVPSVGAAEARALFAEKPGSVLLLDVRPAAKAASDPIPGALSVPLAALRAMKSAAELPPGVAGKHVLVICETGRMAVPAVRRLKALGVRDARRVTGGWRAWRS